MHKHALPYSKVKELFWKGYAASSIPLPYLPRETDVRSQCSSPLTSSSKTIPYFKSLSTENLDILNCTDERSDLSCNDSNEIRICDAYNLVIELVCSGFVVLFETANSSHGSVSLISPLSRHV